MPSKLSQHVKLCPWELCKCHMRARVIPPSVCLAVDQREKDRVLFFFFFFGAGGAVFLFGTEVGSFWPGCIRNKMIFKCTCILFLS